MALRYVSRKINSESNFKKKNFLYHGHNNFNEQKRKEK